jgi:hypothetical protein
MAKWTEIVSEGVGVPYGHVPGHQYHDVDATLYQRPGEYRIDLIEHWGSAQGRDEEHGRREVSGYGATIAEAVTEAKAEAETSGMDMSWVVQVIALVRRAADEAETGNDE